jgi:hypothetical protein
MNISTSRFQYFNQLHSYFSQAYPAVNHYIIDLYALPRNFIMETGPVLDNFIRDYSVPHTPGVGDLSGRAVLEFISEVDKFTRETMVLFEEHKTHVDQCDTYMKKVTQLEQRQQEVGVTKCMPEYIELTPDLIKLNNSLTEIKVKADEMMKRLAGLELRWTGLKPVIQ